MTERKDGRHYLAEIQEIIGDVRDKLPDEAMKEKADELNQRGDKIKKKLFLKTQGGTTLAEKARGEAETLKEKVDAGAPEDEVKAAFDQLAESLEFFIHRAETLIIRMT